MFGCILLRYYMVALMVTFVGAISDLAFTCNKEGNVESISGTNLTSKNVRIILQDKPLKFCTPQNLTINGTCGQQLTNKKDIKIAIEETTQGGHDTKIVGGNHVAWYHLNCTDSSKTYNASNKFTVLPNLSFTTSTKDIPVDLQLKVSTNSSTFTAPNLAGVKIGQPLYLILSVSGNHKIDPQNCKAISDSTNPSRIDLWTFSKGNSCHSEDSSLMAAKWDPFTTAQGDALIITMYAFRFTDSNSVTITCEARVCPKGDTACSRTCVNGSTGSGKRRRRRGIQTLSHVKEASATFTVSSPYKANSAEGLYGVSVKRNLTVSFVISVMFVLLR